MSLDSPTFLKSKKFATRIVNLHKYLENQKHEYIVSKQILRSGTSVIANVSEAIYASSHKDFIAKNQIALKECSETASWLELLNNSGHLTEKQFNSIYPDCKELIKLLASTVKTSKYNEE